MVLIPRCERPEYNSNAASYLLHARHSCALGWARVSTSPASFLTAKPDSISSQVGSAGSADGLRGMTVDSTAGSGSVRPATLACGVGSYFQVRARTIFFPFMHA